MTDQGATILHADLDAFYASVEQLLDPGLRGRPIAVGGGVVLAASYEARAYGVRGAMPAWRARRCCPELEFVAGHFHEYRRLSDQVMEVLNDFTPCVEQVSIDEAFLDVAGARRLFGSPAEIAATIRRRVADDIGLPLSVGVARTKHLAKVASQVAKPDGLVVVPPESEGDFLAPLPVGLVGGVGPATRARLERVGIRTIGELRAVPAGVLEGLVGASGGAKLAQLAANVDPRPVSKARAPSSMGAQAALRRQTATPRLLRSTLGYLADRVGARLRAAGNAGRTVTVRVRFKDLRSVTHATTVGEPVSTTLDLTQISVELARQLLAAHPEERDEVTLLAISVANLVDRTGTQPELPLGDEAAKTRTDVRLRADRSVDVVRERFGRGAVGYAGALLTEADRVPEEFRELAERTDRRRRSASVPDDVVERSRSGQRRSRRPRA